MPLPPPTESARLNRLRRLDDGSTVVFLRVCIGVFAAAMFSLPFFFRGIWSKPDAWWFIACIYGLALVLVLWIRSARQVSFDGEWFVIKDWFSPPVEVPKSHLVRVRAIPLNHGCSFLSLKFDPPTKFGKIVRVMTGGAWKSETFLRLEYRLKSITGQKIVSPAPLEPFANDKAVEVLGWSHSELEVIVADFTELYDLPADQVEITPTKNASLTLHFPADIDVHHFLFLVNYLYQPKHFEVGHRTISARGTATLTSDFKPPQLRLIGTRATFFVPANDTEYDSVAVTVDSGETYRIPFTTHRWKLIVRT